MEVLKAFECQDDILFVVELLGFLAEEGLQFEILAEVVISQVLVDFELVVELLHGCLVVLPQVGCFGGGYLADFLELGLDFLHAGEGAVHIVGVGRYGVEFLNEGEFACEVLVTLLLLGGSQGGFTLADGVHHRLELLLGGVE